MNTFVSRFSWKPKMNHYEKYTDMIRASILIEYVLFTFHYNRILDAKRTVPVRSFDMIRKKLMEPWASWRIDRLTTYLSDLVKKLKI